MDSRRREPREPRDRRREHREERRPADDLCWGRGPVLSLLEEMPRRALKVFISKSAQRSFADRVLSMCRENGVTAVMSDQRALDSMTDGENHQGIAAAVAPAQTLQLSDALALLPRAPEPALALLFDHVQDPHNVGAMIRTAEAVGATFAALPTRRGALPTGVVAKTSAGASLRLPIAAVGNTADAVRRAQDAGLWCVGLEASSERTIYEAGLPERTLLVIGAEDKGLSRTTANACDEVLSIPLRGSVGSLNASIAMAVASFEWLRTAKQMQYNHG